VTSSSLMLRMNFRPRSAASKGLRLVGGATSGCDRNSARNQTSSRSGSILQVKFRPSIRTSSNGKSTSVTEHEHVIFSSYGNDSAALIQWMHEEGLSSRTYVVYSDTKWVDKKSRRKLTDGDSDWMDRVDRLEAWAKRLGFTTLRLDSKGFAQMVRDEYFIPSGMTKGCTQRLKIEPAKRWLKEVDPEKNLICVIGIRRCESHRRASFPEYIAESKLHGGRELWAPLVRHLDPMRDKLLLRAGIQPLPHRSKECDPCIHAKRAELIDVSEDRIQECEELERIVSDYHGRSVYMFRPKDRMGAQGIREVIRWAHSSRGNFVPLQRLSGGPQTEKETDARDGCDSGWCES